MVSVDMLDITVFIDGDRFGWKPFVKPTARHIPLSHHSHHAPFVHKSWPVGGIRRMYKNSLHHSDSVEFKARKIARFDQFFMTDQCLQACYDWAPIPQIANSRVSSVHNGATQVLRIVLPYCPSIKASYALYS